MSYRWNDERYNHSSEGPSGSFPVDREVDTRQADRAGVEGGPLDVNSASLSPRGGPSILDRGRSAMTDQPVEPLSAEEEANLRAQDAALSWEMRRNSLWVKRMTEDWQTPTSDEVAIHRLLATLDAARVAAPSDGLDLERLSEAWANVMDGRRVGQGLSAARIERSTTTRPDWRAIAKEYAALATTGQREGERIEPHDGSCEWPTDTQTADPGGLRAELHNQVERAMTLSDGGTVARRNMVHTAIDVVLDRALTPEATAPEDGS